MGGDEQLHLHYLPVVEISTGSVRTVEALVRWRHPTRGLLPPAAFVPAAAETALAEPLTAFVLARALHQVAAWREEDLQVQVSVNVPARCLRPQFVTTVLDALAAAGWDRTACGWRSPRAVPCTRSGRSPRSSCGCASPG